MPPFIAFSRRTRNDARQLAGYAWLLDLAAVPPAAAVLRRRYGRTCALRFLAATTAAGLIRHAFLRWLTQRTAPDKPSLGDPLSLARLSCGNLLVGLAVSGARDRAGPSGRIGFGAALFGATALDWLDGPLARRSGPTRHGAVLDIEADSWLTLWTAVAAIAWGDLPPWVIVPPLVRYLHPLLDLRRGILPHSGSPGWSRVTGTTQMALLLAALAPIRSRPPRSVVIALAAGASGSQLITQLLAIGQRVRR